MAHPISLSSGLGELMAPQTLVTALVIGPDGQVKLDPGALHGRSELEGQIQLVPRRDLVGEGKPCWLVWVAIEVDDAKTPVRYTGMSVGELLVNPERRLGYKSVAEQVNRMNEAMRGGVNLAKLAPETRSALKAQLVSLGAGMWERSADSLKQAFA